MRSLGLVPVLLLVATSCEQAKAPAARATTSTVAPVASPPKVARIVFIDKVNACDCTRKRIEGTWAALQGALGTPASLPVERIHVDTEASKAEAYTAVKPLMVPPGVYFVDGREAVVDMLQGEVTAAQIAAALEAR